MEILVKVKDYNFAGDKDLMTVEELIELCECLQDEVEGLRIEKEELERDVEENYQKKDIDYGVYDRDFI